MIYKLIDYYCSLRATSVERPCGNKIDRAGNLLDQPVVRVNGQKGWLWVL